MRIGLVMAGVLALMAPAVAAPAPSAEVMQALSRQAAASPSVFPANGRVPAFPWPAAVPGPAASAQAVFYAAVFNPVALDQAVFNAAISNLAIPDRAIFLQAIPVQAGPTAPGPTAPGPTAPGAGQPGRPTPRAVPPRATPPTAQAPRAAQERALVVVNELGLALRELYVAPAGSLEPSADRLGLDTLPAGASLRVPLGRQTLCLFDVRVVLGDGSAQEKRGLDLCRTPRVTFGDPSAPLREATIENATDLTLRELYATPSAPAGRPRAPRPGTGPATDPTAERGADRLGAEVVVADSSFTLRLGRTRECVWDITAVFEDDTVEERRRVDLCRRARLAFGDASLPRREVEVANGSGRAMRNLYATTVPLAAGESRAAEQWGTDRLAAVQVEAGDSFRLRLRTRACLADLRTVYDDDTAEEKRGIDLCATSPRVLFDGSGVPRPAERAFTLVNRHGASVEEVYASAINESDWGDDKLAGSALERGGRHEVTLQGGCEVDLRIVFANGGAEERRGIDICATSLVVLRPGWTLAAKLDQNPGAIEPAAPREGSVRLRNTAGSPMVELYVHAPDAPRGPDRLGATVLGRGETLDFQPPEDIGCTATLSAVFRDGRDVVRPGFNLCSGTEVALP